MSAKNCGSFATGMSSPFRPFFVIREQGILRAVSKLRRRVRTLAWCVERLRKGIPMRFVRSSIALAVAAALPAAAFAQNAQQDADAIQEIIVTAQKRESTLQDVPFSIAAVTESQIRNSGASDLPELARNIAGLTVTDLGPG